MKNKTSMTKDELRSALESAGVSQTALAESLGVNPRTVRRWISGESRISKFIVPTIKQILKVKK